MGLIEAVALGGPEIGGGEADVRVDLAWPGGSSSEVFWGVSSCYMEGGLAAVFVSRDAAPGGIELAGFYSPGAGAESRLGALLVAHEAGLAAEENVDVDLDEVLGRMRAPMKTGGRR